MKPTQYVRNKSELTDFARAFRGLHPLNWYVRTTLECDHRVNERRKAIMLISDEKVVQRLIVCGTCKKASLPNPSEGRALENETINTNTKTL